MEQDVLLLLRVSARAFPPPVLRERRPPLAAVFPRQKMRGQSRINTRRRIRAREMCGKMYLRNTLCALIAILIVVPAAPAVGQSTMGLHEAALVGNVDGIRQHILAGTDLNERDAFGSTALTVAATFGKTQVAEALIEAGADLNIANNDGATPLHAAAFFCHSEIVEALLKKGANGYLRDNFGNTPRESVTAPFEKVKGIYDVFAQALEPLGLELDYEHLRITRPKIAEMLRPDPAELATANFVPLERGDWKVSTPEKQDLDSTAVAELYLDATGLTTLRSLLVIKNGYLVAEGYFTDGSIEQKALLQSATKSYISALVGIAFDRGCLSSLDQKMIDFFPEFRDQITDPRKKQITIRDMLQMRAGYPWEETDPVLWDGLLSGDQLPLMADFPLVSDPGTEFNYSNTTTYWLGVIVARACDTDLKLFAEEHLFSLLGVEVGEWWQDKHGYYFPVFHFSARDAAKFGLMYLNDGRHEGEQIVPAEWVRESLQVYSKDAFDESRLVFSDIGYGYQWWSARAGHHRFDYAWGHGGQLIILLHELDMIIVVISEPFFLQHDDESWRHERANINLVGRFIESLPRYPVPAQ